MGSVRAREMGVRGHSLYEGEEPGRGELLRGPYAGEDDKGEDAGLWGSSDARDQTVCAKARTQTHSSNTA